MEKETEANGRKRCKSPFAVFVCTKEMEEKNNDYKKVILKIILDRIEEKRYN